MESESKSCRCNLAGRDLNRQYKNVIKEAFPPVFQVLLILYLGFMKNIPLVALYLCLKLMELKKRKTDSLYRPMIFICQVKQLIKKLLEEGTIAMYCDFHAHSRKVKIISFFWQQKYQENRKQILKVAALTKTYITCTYIHFCSFQFNIFMYGCENRRHSEKYLKEQVILINTNKIQLL